MYKVRLQGQRRTVEVRGQLASMNDGFFQLLSEGSHEKPVLLQPACHLLEGPKRTKLSILQLVFLSNLDDVRWLLIGIVIGKLAVQHLPSVEAPQSVGNEQKKRKPS